MHVNRYKNNFNYEKQRIILLLIFRIGYYNFVSCTWRPTDDIDSETYIILITNEFHLKKIIEKHGSNKVILLAQIFKRPRYS